MVWWLQFIIIWLSIDLIILATGWYIATLKPYFPNWWERVIACEVEPNLDLDAEPIEVPSLSIGSKVTK